MMNPNQYLCLLGDLASDQGSGRALWGLRRPWITGKTRAIRVLGLDKPPRERELRIL